MTDRCIGIKEAAEHLGVKVETLYAWIHRKQIPYYKVGRLVKFRNADIERWLNERRVEVLEI